MKAAAAEPRLTVFEAIADDSTRATPSTRLRWRSYEGQSSAQHVLSPLSTHRALAAPDQSSSSTTVTHSQKDHGCSEVITKGSPAQGLSYHPSVPTELNTFTNAHKVRFTLSKKWMSRSDRGHCEDRASRIHESDGEQSYKNQQHRRLAQVI